MNEKIRNVSTEPKYDGSASWINEHFSISKRGSLVVGVLSEIYGEWRNYINFNVIPVIVRYIRECLHENKKIVLYCKEIEPQKYVLDAIKLKIKNKIDYRLVNDNIENIVMKCGKEGTKAIIITDNQTAYSLKHLIESL